MTRQPRRGFEIGAGLALLAIVALAYHGALDAAFQFDDFAVIVDNPRVHGIPAWWQALPGIRPLLKLSYAFNWWLAPTATAFHALNLLLHGINAWLLWRLARHWLRALAPDVPVEAPAWLCAALFALHPATTEAVTYASGRSISLSATFVLAALLADAHGRDRQRWAWRSWLAPTCFLAALATRETSLTVPFAIALFGWFANDDRRTLARALTGHAVVLVVASALALSLPGYDYFFHWSLQTRDAAGQVLGQLVAHAHLFTHSLLGLRSNIDPDLRIPAALTPSLALTALAITAAVATAIGARRRWPWLGFGLLWYLLQLAPSNSLLPRFDLANDRHLYLAVCGPALIVAVAMFRWLTRAHAQAALAAALLALCGGATLERNRDYRSELALWTATVEASAAKPRAWLNLGYARRQAGDLPGAGRAYACALALSPGYEQAQFNLVALESEGLALDRVFPAARCPIR